MYLHFRDNLPHYLEEAQAFSLEFQHLVVWVQGVLIIQLQLFLLMHTDLLWALNVLRRYCVVLTLTPIFFCS